MATLHQAIETTRTILKWGGILVGGIFLAFTLYRGGLFVRDVFFPKPPPPPTMKFGQLPRLEFPKSTSAGNYTYTINTVSGFLPVFPDRVNVYTISHDEPNLLDLQRARSVAFNLNLKSADVRVSDTVYSWSVFDEYSRKLVMDIVSKNFIYTTDFVNYKPLTSYQGFIDEETAKRKARDFLSKASSLPETINQKTKTSLYKFLDGKLTQASNLAETQVIRVDFFHEDIDKMPIYSKSPITSPVNLLVSNLQSQLTESHPVVEANYYYHNITKVSSTYPIKTAQEAFDELQNGDAYIAANFNTERTTIPIRNVLLAYYVADERLDFLMPIIVFTDNDGFYAYVSAIKDSALR
jgi:hypothetical protein